MPLPAGTVVVSLYPPQAPSGGSGATPIGSLPSSPSGAAGWQWCSTRSPPVIIGGINYYEDVGPADAWIGTGFSGEPTIGAVPPGFGNPYTNGTGTYAGSYRSAITAFQAHPGRTPFVSPPMPSCSSPPPGGGTQPTGGGGGGGSPPGACTTLCGPLTIQTTCESPIWIKPCPDPVPPPAPCELTIAWLSLHYPDFVQAERSAAKTDYDILLDAFRLGLCAGTEPQMPECSVPYLERIAPAFVQAAKSQGKTDVEMLVDAANVGLCAKVPDTDLEALGAEAVDILAPGSEQTIESEFDPPIPPGVQTTPVNTGATAHCPPAQFVLPDFSNSGIVLPAGAAECLAGLDEVALVVSLTVAQVVKDLCECPDNSIIDKLFVAAEQAEKQWSIAGKIVGPALRFLGNVFRSGACNIQVISNYVQAITRCGIGDSVPVMGLALLAGVWDKWVGTLPEVAKDAIHRAVAFACPTGVPSTPESNALYAANFVNKDTWQCLMRANGDRIDYNEKVVQSLRSRPTDDQLLLLQRKLRTAADNAAAGTPQPGDPGADYIPGFQDQIAGYFQQNGWTDPQNFSWWETAQTWVPAPTDAVEWMLKDVADPQIQDTFLLGAEFAQKYNGHVKDVFAWNGIQDRDAEFIWRAHWRNMAPTTLYELHKRLRPGWTALMSDEDVTHLVTAICPRPPANDSPAQRALRPVSNGFPVPAYCDELLDPITQRKWLESLTTDGYHVSEGLGQDDYAPFWRQRLLAISYHVMGRIDIRRAYEIGEFSLERVQAGYQDQGYSPGDALAQAKFTRANAIQLHSRRPAVGQWVNTGYDPQLLRTALIRQGMREDMWEDVYAIAKAKRAIRIQTECINGIKKPYLIGIMDAVTASTRLANLGLDGNRVIELLNEWDCIRASRSKQESAALICLYFKVGLITGDVAQDLLINLGYTKARARRILATCYIRKLPKTVQPEKLPEALALLGTLP